MSLGYSHLNMLMHTVRVRRTLFSTLQLHKGIGFTLEFENYFKVICFIKPDKLYGLVRQEIDAKNIFSGDIIRPE